MISDASTRERVSSPAQDDDTTLTRDVALHQILSLASVLRDYIQLTRQTDLVDHPCNEALHLVVFKPLTLLRLSRANPHSGSKLLHRNAGSSLLLCSFFGFFPSCSEEDLPEKVPESYVSASFEGEVDAPFHKGVFAGGEGGVETVEIAAFDADR